MLPREPDAEISGNICGALPTGERQLMTATPLQKNVCAVRRVKTAMYCPRVGDCSKQNGKIVYAGNRVHYFSVWNKIEYERMIVNARDLEKH